jgi:diamine N-acetyltransferase
VGSLGETQRPEFWISSSVMILYYNKLARGKGDKFSFEISDWKEGTVDTPAIGRDSKVSFQEITEDTVVPICKLSNTLSAAQQKMVAQNAISIAQAHFNPCAWFRAIYAEETPVGFIMLYDNAEEPKYFLWRLMIAGPYQRMGFGEKGIQLLIEYVRTRPAATELFVSCGQGEGSPEGFYTKLGFRRTGEIEDGEIVLKLPLE